ncbi:hypothetical protein BESB_062250 [Besnoitia besnoiti]|uniref:SAG-related sequence n=1 Tax=Besnoitia besnoiti TaxID=94643 RepID=A0A2A9MA45_BESBE|nr:hypothetical protein BESB_062250 [Besnoitia besnoiti]PFH35338.1 hypothetical protein BESB_062250 [Besnoitia besnoiti]
MAGGHVPSRGLALGAVLAVWLLSSTICVVRARDAVTPSKPAECTANGTGLKVTVDVNTLQAAFACGAGLEKLWPNADNDLTSYCENNTCKATAKLAKTFGSGTTLTKNSATTYTEGPEAPSASSSATVYTLADLISVQGVHPLPARKTRRHKPEKWGGGGGRHLKLDGAQPEATATSVVMVFCSRKQAPWAD